MTILRITHDAHTHTHTTVHRDLRIVVSKGRRSAHHCADDSCVPLLIRKRTVPIPDGEMKSTVVTYLTYIPRFRLNTYGRRAFSAAGPMAWNSLSDFIRDTTSSTDCLSVYSKRSCSRVTSASSALGVQTIMRYINPTAACTCCYTTL